MLFTVLVSFSVVSYIREKTDCLVLTFSGDTEIAGDLRDDRTATEEAILEAWDSGIPWPEKLLTDNGPESVGTFNIPMNDEDLVEFEHLKTRYSFEYEDPGTFETTQADRERHMLIRVFTPETTVTHASIDCPVAATAEIQPTADLLTISDIPRQTLSETPPQSDAPRRIDGKPNSAYVFSFDDFFFRLGGPYWHRFEDRDEVEIAPGWRQVDLESEDPVAEFKNVDSACTIYAVNAYDKHTYEDVTKPSDRESTASNAVSRILDLPAIDAEADDIEQLDDHLVPLETGQWLEMEHYRVRYEAGTEPRERDTLIRVFQPASQLVQLNLDCPAGSSAEAAEILGKMRAYSDIWAEVPEVLPE